MRTSRRQRALAVATTSAILSAVAGLAAVLAAAPDGLVFALHLAAGAASGLVIGELCARAGLPAGTAALLSAGALLVAAVAAGPIDCRSMRTRRAAELDELFSVRLMVGALDEAEASYRQRQALRRFGPVRCTAARFGVVADVASERNRAVAALLGLTAALGAGLAARLARQRAKLLAE